MLTCRNRGGRKGPLAALADLFATTSCVFLVAAMARGASQRAEQMVIVQPDAEQTSSSDRSTRADIAMAQLRIAMADADGTRVIYQYSAPGSGAPTMSFDTMQALLLQVRRDHPVALRFEADARAPYGAVSPLFGAAATMQLELYSLEDPT